ncbi:hypothetical protein [Undibacterium sp. Di24W]|uniref:hypothetical protein n=1 Tax=Undibacterium sp. Di24W TaxID=3413033 RepID=UPI003BF1CBB3
MKNHLFKKLLIAMALVEVSAVTLNANAHDRYSPVQVYSRPAPVQFYDFVYYPSHQVYFSPRARTWYWSEGALWRSGGRLPFGIDLKLGGIPIQLRSALPYYDHVYVEQRYGRPWRTTHYDHHDYLERRDFDDRYGRHHRYNRRDDLENRHDGHSRW